jgi:hypothetical protein
VPKERGLTEDSDRLLAATTMFVRQQWERASYGDDEDYHDVREEAQQVVSQVLDTIEKNLDEDLLEKLDRGEYPRVVSSVGYWSRLRGWRSVWPYWNYDVYGSWSPSRRVRRRLGRSNDMLDEILEDFRSDFEERLRRARRDDRGLTDAELDEALQALKEDLSVVARRSRRREDRRDDEEGPRRRRPARESRTA